MSAPAELVAFVQREQPRLVRAIHLLLDDHAVAEEVVQEALLRAASRWERVSVLSSPGGWVHRVAINLATSQLRRRQAERRARSRVGEPAPARRPDTEAAMEVRRGLVALPDATRRLLVLRYVLDWTAEDIATVDGVRADAVRQRLRRAREALRAELDPSIGADQPFRPSSTDPREATDAH